MESRNLSISVRFFFFKKKGKFIHSFLIPFYLKIRFFFLFLFQVRVRKTKDYYKGPYDFFSLRRIINFILLNMIFSGIFFSLFIFSEKLFLGFFFHFLGRSYIAKRPKKIEEHLWFMICADLTKRVTGRKIISFVVCVCVNVTQSDTINAIFNHLPSSLFFRGFKGFEWFFMPIVRAIFSAFRVQSYLSSQICRFYSLAVLKLCPWNAKSILIVPDSPKYGYSMANLSSRSDDLQLVISRFGR